MIEQPSRLIKIAIKNNKGGVGKTFLTTQLGSGLAIFRKKSININIRFTE